MEIVLLVYPLVVVIVTLDLMMKFLAHVKTNQEMILILHRLALILLSLLEIGLPRD